LHVDLDVELEKFLQSRCTRHCNIGVNLRGVHLFSYTESSLGIVQRGAMLCQVFTRVCTTNMRWNVSSYRGVVDWPLMISVYICVD